MSMGAGRVYKLLTACEQVDEHTLFSLLLAAAFLDVPSLQKLCTQTVHCSLQSGALLDCRAGKRERNRAGRDGGQRAVDGRG